MPEPLGQFGLRCNRCGRSERSLGTARLAVLEGLGHKMGFMSGPLTHGPKPTRMTEAHPELQVAGSHFREALLVCCFCIAS